MVWAATEEEQIMPTITLPDGSKRDYANPVTVADVAADIGAGLAKAALAGKVEENLVDTSYLIENDVNLAIVTERDDDGVDVIRHSTAHLLAQAVKELYPKAQVTIGPVIENGFYYDFSYADGFNDDDLKKIEKKMEELAKKDEQVKRKVCHAMRLLSFSKTWVRTTRRRLLLRFLRMKIFLYIVRVTLLICVEVPMYRLPAS